MSKKAPLAARPPADDISKELEYLYAHLAAVEALIRALEHYREFGPHLIIEHTGTA